MHDYACAIMQLHNASLEGPKLFGPPKILAQLRLCLLSYVLFIPPNLILTITDNKRDNK